MYFEKLENEDTWVVGDGGGIFGLVTKETADPDDEFSTNKIFFEFQKGINPSLSLEEMKELVVFMEGVK